MLHDRGARQRICLQFYLERGKTLGMVAAEARCCSTSRAHPLFDRCEQPCGSAMTATTIRAVAYPETLLRGRPAEVNKELRVTFCGNGVPNWATRKCTHPEDFLKLRNAGGTDKLQHPNDMTSISGNVTHIDR